MKGFFSELKALVLKYLILWLQSHTNEIDENHEEIFLDSLEKMSKKKSKRADSVLERHEILKSQHKSSGVYELEITPNQRGIKSLAFYKDFDNMPVVEFTTYSNRWKFNLLFDHEVAELSTVLGIYGLEIHAYELVEESKKIYVEE